jgi:hypothetical protein
MRTNITQRGKAYVEALPSTYLLSSLPRVARAMVQFVTMTRSIPRVDCLPATIGRCNHCALIITSCGGGPKSSREDQVKTSRIPQYDRREVLRKEDIAGSPPFNNCFNILHANTKGKGPVKKYCVSGPLDGDHITPPGVGLIEQNHLLRLSKITRLRPVNVRP